MQFRSLGNSGLKVSVIGLGGWLTFDKQLARQAMKAVFDAAFAAGVNFFDTADVYDNGNCEKVWGEYLAKKPRSSYVLATKCFFPTGEGPNDRGLSRKHILESCRASCKRLRTDYIDLFQCHRFDPDTPLEETVRAMDDLIRQGTVLYWGFSQWTAEQIEACLRFCGDRFSAPRSSQPLYNAITRDAEAAVFPLCKTAGIGQVVFSPLAQGVLTGKYRTNIEPPRGSRGTDAYRNQWIKPMLADAMLLDRVAKLAPIAEAAGCTTAQLAIAWVLRRPEVSSAIVGATHQKQMQENAAAADVVLSGETLARIDDVLRS